MKPLARIPLRTAPRLFNASPATRPIHSTVVKAANVAPIVGTGPPPEPPTPTAQLPNERLERRRRQAELLKNVRELRSAQGGKLAPLKKRFWKEVAVEEVDGA